MTTELYLVNHISYSQAIRGGHVIYPRDITVIGVFDSFAAIDTFLDVTYAVPMREHKPDYRIQWYGEEPLWASATQEELQQYRPHFVVLKITLNEGIES